jgi:tetratricopeptide (TPR) repeat protein
VAGATIVILGLAVAVLGHLFRPETSQIGMDDPQRVAVVPFENRTGDPTLDPVGHIAADWIGEFIVRTGFVEVVDFNTAMAMRASTENGEVALATGTGAGTLVTGSFYKQGDTLTIQAKILRGDGTVLIVLPQVAGEAGDPIEVIDRLRERVVTALAAHFDRRLPSFEGLGGDPPSFAAYEKYVSGLKWYLQGDHARAGDDFQDAIEIDSTFARARVWLLASRGFSDPESVDSLGAEINRRESTLSVYDRHHARFFTAFVKGDLEQAYYEANAMLEASPGSRDAVREKALSAIRVGRPQEGVRLLRGLSQDRVLLESWSEYWRFLSFAELELGNAESALRVAREGRATHPDSPDPITAEALALIDLGRIGEAVQAAELIFQMQGSRGWRGTGLLAIAARASARGHQDVANTLLAKTIHWIQPLDEEGIEEIYVRVLLAAGRLEEARVLVEEHFAAGQRDATAVGTYGIINARQGNLEAASSALRELAGPSGTGNRIWRARILAVLGEEREALRVLGRIHVDPYGVEFPVAVWPEFANMRGDPGFPGLPARDSDP